MRVILVVMAAASILVLCSCGATRVLVKDCVDTANSDYKECSLVK